MRIVEGDLFAGDRKAIGHGVNCKGVMGAGIAVLFKKKFPEMYVGYREACETGELKPGGVFIYRVPGEQWVYNIASQNLPGADARKEWLAKGLASVLDHAASVGVQQVSIPAIGCGIGGLELDDLKSVVEEVERNRTSTFEIVLLPS